METVFLFEYLEQIHRCIKQTIPWQTVFLALSNLPFTKINVP